MIKKTIGYISRWSLQRQAFHLMRSVSTVTISTKIPQSVPHCRDFLNGPVFLQLKEMKWQKSSISQVFYLRVQDVAVSFDKLSFR